jgi:hypothetical protein
MLKLYKTEAETIYYAECWVNDGVATVHTGVVGDMGQKKEQPCENEDTFMNDFLHKYIEPFPNNQGLAT